jgi:hypothetical protein
MLRTIRRGDTPEMPLAGQPVRVNVDQTLKCIVHFGWETQKAREDATSHERGLLPVPPSEFLNPCSR